MIKDKAITDFAMRVVERNDITALEEMSNILFEVYNEGKYIYDRFDGIYISSMALNKILGKLNALDFQLAHSTAEIYSVPLNYLVSNIIMLYMTGVRVGLTAEHNEDRKFFREYYSLKNKRVRVIKPHDIQKEAERKEKHRLAQQKYRAKQKAKKGVK